MLYKYYMDITQIMLEYTSKESYRKNMKILLTIIMLIVMPLNLSGKEMNAGVHSTSDVVSVSNNTSTSTIEKNNVTNDITKQMEDENSFLDGLEDKWIELIGLLIAFLTFFLPIYRYITQKREELQNKRFVTYHELIRDLVQADEKGIMKLDRQIAIAFELRNYPTYYNLTKRLFTDLKEQWSNDPKNKRIVKELSLTIEHIENNSNWFKRLLNYFR